MFRPVGMGRESHHQSCRLPFSDQFPDFGKPCRIRLGADDRQRSRAFREIVSYGAADPFQPEIETEDDRRGDVHRVPAVKT